MAGNSPAHARLVAATYDFSEMSVVSDVGGGRGRLLATILERYPRLRGILFDQPHVSRRSADPRGVGVVDRWRSSSEELLRRGAHRGDATSCATSFTTGGRSGVAI